MLDSKKRIWPTAPLPEQLPWSAQTTHLLPPLKNAASKHCRSSSTISHLNIRKGSTPPKKTKRNVQTSFLGLKALPAGYQKTLYLRKPYQYLAKRVQVQALPGGALVPVAQYLKSYKRPSKGPGPLPHLTSIYFSISIS